MNGQSAWLQLSLKDFLQSFSLVWRSGRNWLLLTIVLEIAQALIPIAIFITTKQLIDLLTTSMGPNTLNVASWYLILLGGLGFAISALQSLTRVSSEVLRQQAKDYIYSMLHQKAASLDLEHFESPEFHNVLYRALEQSPHRPPMIVSNLLSILRSAISLSAIIALLITYRFSAVVVLLLLTIPSLSARIRYAGRLDSLLRQRTPETRRAWYLHEILTQIKYAQEVRIFGLARHFARQFAEARCRLRQDQLRDAQRRAAMEFVTGITETVPLLIVLMLLVRDATFGLITTGTFVMYFQAVMRARDSMQQLLTSIADAYENQLFLGSYRELMKLETRIADAPEPVRATPPGALSIVFENVCFGYPAADSLVFDGLSFCINAGEHVAIVGENGAGKTTLIKLLCRLYDPLSGSICVNGHNAKEYRVASYRRLFAVTCQDFIRYSFSARENIVIGDIENPIDDDSVRQAGRSAEIDDTLSLLPQGYSTILGCEMEGGSNLSAGQWQRIAIARAFYRDSPCVILDEPSSTLDAHRESALMERLRDLTSGRTAIIISHRLSLVQQADRIMVLQNGAIAESGSHEELLQRQGIYFSLYQSQARHYRSAACPAEPTGEFYADH